MLQKNNLLLAAFLLLANATVVQATNPSAYQLARQLKTAQKNLSEAAKHPDRDVKELADTAQKLELQLQYRNFFARHWGKIGVLAADNKILTGICTVSALAIATLVVLAVSAKNGKIGETSTKTTANPEVLGNQGPNPAADAPTEEAKPEAQEYSARRGQGSSGVVNEEKE
jgi:hypothetical protein